MGKKKTLSFIIVALIVAITLLVVNETDQFNIENKVFGNEINNTQPELDAPIESSYHSSENPILEVAEQPYILKCDSQFDQLMNEDDLMNFSYDDSFKAALKSIDSYSTRTAYALFLASHSEEHVIDLLKLLLDGS